MYKNDKEKWFTWGKQYTKVFYIKFEKYERSAHKPTKTKTLILCIYMCLLLFLDQIYEITTMGFWASGGASRASFLGGLTGDPRSAAQTRPSLPSDVSVGLFIWRASTTYRYWIKSSVSLVALSKESFGSAHYRPTLIL